MGMMSVFMIYYVHFCVSYRRGCIPQALARRDIQAYLNTSITVSNLAVIDPPPPHTLTQSLRHTCSKSNYTSGILTHLGVR